MSNVNINKRSLSIKKNWVPVECFESGSPPETYVFDDFQLMFERHIHMQINIRRCEQFYHNGKIALCK